MVIDHRTIPDKIRYDYSFIAGNPIKKTLEGIQTVQTHSLDPDFDVGQLLNETVDLIRRQFEIDSVSIGLLDKDGFYRYKAMAGFRAEAVEEYKKTVYRKEQFFEDAEFNGHAISKYSRIYLQEDNLTSTENERLLFGHPGLLGMRRRDATASLEGDYIDTGIYDGDDNLIGWIEFSGTRTRKLPEATTIRWIEVIASIVALALKLRGLTENTKKSM